MISSISAALNSARRPANFSAARSATRSIHASLAAYVSMESSSTLGMPPSSHRRAAVG